jgi:hypothetical protein
MHISGCHRVASVEVSHQPTFSLRVSALRLIGGCPAQLVESSSPSRSSRDQFRLLASDFWLLDSPKKVFFAERTQSCSMFTGKFEKIQSQLKPFQSQKKPIQTQSKANISPLQSQFPCPP